MSVILNDMEKPGGCRECEFCTSTFIIQGFIHHCNRMNRDLDDEEVCNIPSDCPISVGWVSVEDEPAPLKRLVPCAVIPVHRKY